MKIRILSRDTNLTGLQRGDAERRLNLELARYGSRIGKVTLLITRGARSEAGFDQCCELNVAIPPRTVRAELQAPALTDALAGVAQRVARTIARLIELELLPTQ